VPLAAITLTSIILWGICLLLAVGVAWTRYEKKKTREKFIAELLAMDPDRREKVLSRLRPDVQTDLRQGLMERYRIGQGGR
jgi:cytochrome c-type biogenesis protein CcmH/NrfF